MFYMSDKSIFRSFVKTLSWPLFWEESISIRHLLSGIEMLVICVTSAHLIIYHHLVLAYDFVMISLSLLSLDTLHLMISPVFYSLLQSPIICYCNTGSRSKQQFIMGIPHIIYWISELQSVFLVRTDHYLLGREGFVIFKNGRNVWYRQGLFRNHYWGQGVSRFCHSCRWKKGTQPRVHEILINLDSLGEWMNTVKISTVGKQIRTDMDNEWRI